MGKVKAFMYDVCIRAAELTAPKTMVDLNNAADFIFNRWIESDPTALIAEMSTFDGISIGDYEMDDLQGLYVALANAYFTY